MILKCQGWEEDDDPWEEQKKRKKGHLLWGIDYGENSFPPRMTMKWSENQRFSTSFFWICESLDSFFVSESICCCSRGSLSNRKWTNFQRLFMNMLRLSRTLSTRKWQARLILTKRWPIMTQDGERTSNMLMQFKCFKTAKAKFRFNEKSVG